MTGLRGTPPAAPAVCKGYVNIANHPLNGVNGWTGFGPRTFNSSPSCSFDDPYRYTAPENSNQSSRSFFGGRSSDSKIYTLHGHQDPAGGSMTFRSNPTWDANTQWAVIDNNAAYSGNYGRPALASNCSTLVLTFLNNDRKPHAYTRVPIRGRRAVGVVLHGWCGHGLVRAGGGGRGAALAAATGSSVRRRALAWLDERPMFAP